MNFITLIPLLFLKRKLARQYIVSTVYYVVDYYNLLSLATKKTWEDTISTTSERVAENTAPF